MLNADSRRRVLEALTHRLPDRVPYLELSISDAVIEAVHPGLDYLGFCEPQAKGKLWSWG